MKWVKETFTRNKPKPKGWVTVNDIVQMTGNNRRTVSSRLLAMVKNNELEVMDCMENGKNAKCYKKK